MSVSEAVSCTSGRSAAGAVPDGRVRGALRPALVELHLVHRPHRALHVLHAHEALVQRQVVADRVLFVLIHFITARGVFNATYVRLTVVGHARLVSVIARLIDVA